jgi:hypothetical protein
MVWYHNPIFAYLVIMVWYGTIIPFWVDMVWSKAAFCLCSLLGVWSISAVKSLASPPDRLKRSSLIRLLRIPYSAFGNYGMVWYGTIIPYLVVTVGMIIHRRENRTMFSVSPQSESCLSSSPHCGSSSRCLPLPAPRNTIWYTITPYLAIMVWYGTIIPNLVVMV